MHSASALLFLFRFFLLLFLPSAQMLPPLLRIGAFASVRTSRGPKGVTAPAALRRRTCATFCAKPRVRPVYGALRRALSVFLKIELINFPGRDKITAACKRLGARQGRASRGDSGALYLQPATAGMNPGPRRQTVPPAPYKQR